MPPELRFLFTKKVEPKLLVWVAWALGPPRHAKDVLIIGEMYRNE